MSSALVLGQRGQNLAAQFLLEVSAPSHLCPPSKSEPRSRLLLCLCPEFQAHDKDSVVVEIINKCLLAHSSVGIAFVHGDL